MNDTKPQTNGLALMTLSGPFTVYKGDRMVVSIATGDYMLVCKPQFDEMVDEFLKARDAAE